MTLLVSIKDIKIKFPLHDVQWFHVENGKSPINDFSQAGHICLWISFT